MDKQKTTVEARRRQRPRSGIDPSARLSPSPRRLLLSASLHLLVRKARRGARIERREIAAMLPFAERGSRPGATA